MSDYERNKGKLIPVEIDIWLLTEEDVDDLWDKGLVCLGDKWYKVEFEVKRDTDSTSFAEVNENADGTISFHTYHYNGGAHWSELVEEELSK